jgi:hypothetical protein
MKNIDVVTHENQTANVEMPSCNLYWVFLKNCDYLYLNASDRIELKTFKDCGYYAFDC